MPVRVVDRGSVRGGLVRLWAAAGHTVSAVGRGGGDAAGPDVVAAAVPAPGTADARAKGVRCCRAADLRRLRFLRGNRRVVVDESRPPPTIKSPARACSRAIYPPPSCRPNGYRSTISGRRLRLPMRGRSHRAAESGPSFYGYAPVRRL
jgi:hypothetical protein